MNNFKDFNIKPKINSFVGEKIQVQKLFNLSITVLAFKVEPSKLKRVPDDKFPFATVIKGDNDYYEFT